MRFRVTLVCLLLLSLVLVGCDLVIDVENGTGSTVEVAFEGEPRRVLRPGETASLASTNTPRAPVRITVRDRDGTVLLDQSFTYQDLESRHFRVVVE